MSTREQTTSGSIESSPTVSHTYSSSNAQLQDIKEEDDGIKEDILLPPLPCKDDDNESSPFDLSRALQIPCSVNPKDNNGPNSGNNYINENSDGSSNDNNDISVPLGSPRISLKKKFSNALSNTGESSASPVPFPNESPFSELDTGALTRPMYGFRSQSSSNATSFQHILPTLNRAINESVDTSNSSSNNTTSSENHLAHFFDTGKPLRKSTTNSSSSSSRSDTSVGASGNFLHKLPSPRMSLKTRSRSNSNLISTSLSLECGGTTPTTVMNTPNSSSRNLESKRAPLLRRASSALTRKNSKRNVAAAGSGVKSNSASSTPILQPSAFFEIADPIQRTPPKEKTSSNSIDGSNYFRSEHSFLPDEDDNINYVTQFGRSASRNPSIGSKVKRGFSRIMSTGGSMKKVVSSTSLRSDYKLAQQQSQQSQQSQPQRPQLQGSQSQQPQQQYVQQPQPQHPKQSIDNDTNRGGINMPRGSLAGVFDSGIISRSSGTLTPISTSTVMSPRNNHWLKNPQGPSNQFGETQEPTLGLGMEWKPSNNSMQTREQTSYPDKNTSVSPDSIKSDITVDLDKLTKTIPVITVTDDLRVKGCTPIQVQSNIALDEIFIKNDAGARLGKSENAYRNNNNNNNNNNNSNESTNTKISGAQKPEMMSLADYVRVLVKQQQVEDERLAIIEKNFKDSGWCSRNDLKNLRLKRVIISKKWAERISHYQSRLDS